MSLNRKYANLPDLDSAPDTYETPSLTDDNSTAPTGRPQSDSDASSYKDFEDDEDTPGISRSHLNPDEARSIFLPAQIDARNVDFSDRVNAKRKSYKTSTRRQRQREDGTLEYGDLSDEEGESLERKLARLRREVEEVKEEYRRRQAEQQAPPESAESDLEVATLSKVLDGISTGAGKVNSTYDQFTRSLGTGVSANGPPQTSHGKEGSATYTVTYAPTYQQSHALAKAADFDDRLSMLERALGLGSNAASTTTSKAIVSSLETLQSQILLLTTSTPSSLDSISRRVRTLTQEAERLEQSRKAAKAARDALKAAGGDITEEEGEDTEQTAKVNALYGTLSTIETLSPVLPLLLDRLRSLRAIHANAATASESLEQVEQKQAEQAGEIEKWREGLQRVEEAIKNGEAVMGSNVKTVEGWVKELEQRGERL